MLWLTAMISVVTPLHAPGNAFIREAYATLCGQTVRDWIWYILENNGGALPADIVADERVRQIVASNNVVGIGELKHVLCTLAAGPFILELDADDLLAPNALERVLEAFERGADFVYSDFAEFEDGTWAKERTWYPYREAFGWGHYAAEWAGHPLWAMRAPPVTAHNIRLIDWAPNHVRAWRKTCYEAVGKHDPKLDVADDHDLIVRMFLAGAKFVHVPECLYFYRRHAANTSFAKKELIKAASWAIYDRYVWKLAEKWAGDQKLEKIDLYFKPHESPPGYRAIDIKSTAGVGTRSVGIIRAYNVFQYADPIRSMNECFSMLAPGGWLMVDVPSTNGPAAFMDPRVESFWNRFSFDFYGAQPARDIAPERGGFKGAFQKLRVHEVFPTEAHQRDGMPYVEAHLVKLGDGYIPVGEK